MYCKHCGELLPEDTVVCPFCNKYIGEEIKQTQQYLPNDLSNLTTQNLNKPNDRKKKLLPFFIILAIVLITVVIAVVVSMNSAKDTTDDASTETTTTTTTTEEEETDSLPAGKIDLASTHLDITPSRGIYDEYDNYVEFIDWNTGQILYYESYLLNAGFDIYNTSSDEDNYDYDYITFIANEDSEYFITIFDNQVKYGKNVAVVGTIYDDSGEVVSQYENDHIDKESDNENVVTTKSYVYIQEETTYTTTQFTTTTRARMCTECYGSGSCHYCNGSGVRRPYMSDDLEKCIICNGYGKCTGCNGEGYR